MVSISNEKIWSKVEKTKIEEAQNFLIEDGARCLNLIKGVQI